MAKPQKPVVKPILYGSWHEKSATRKGYKLMLSVLFISVLYMILGLMLSFDSPILRILTSAILILFGIFYMYAQGATAGESDVHFSEIIYQHQQEGKPIDDEDRKRCYHKGKGFYEIGISLIPYWVITLLFAVLTHPIVYSLGVLPTWLAAPMQTTKVADALAYYNTDSVSMFLPILRIISRAITMPFINIAIIYDNSIVLLAERLTPLFVSIAPLAYGFGYLQGPKLRTKVNTGIKVGVNTKKRKERKARKVRAASKTPERLI